MTDEIAPEDAAFVLLQMIDRLEITGPDGDGYVWATCSGPGGDLVSINLGKPGSLLADAGLRYAEAI